MDLEERIRLANSCYGCGKLNTAGLQLDVVVADGVARATYRSRPEHQGFPGLVHGGIVATLLDEVMGWVMYTAGVWAVTAKMDLRYRRPVPVGADLMLEARIERQKGRMLKAHAEARSAESGEVLVESDGLFMRVPQDRQKDLDTIFQPEFRL